MTEVADVTARVERLGDSLTLRSKREWARCYRAKQAEKGLCRHCNQPAAPERSSCEEHLALHRAQKNTKNRRRGVALSHKRCTICRELGHQRPACPMRLAMRAASRAIRATLAPVPCPRGPIVWGCFP